MSTASGSDNWNNVGTEGTGQEFPGVATPGGMRN